MKTQLLTWLRENWKSIKNILIGLGVLILLLSFISNWVQSDRYQKIKKDHKELKAQKELAFHQKDSLDKIYKESQQMINALNTKSDSIKLVSDKTILDMKRKEGQYLQVIADLKNIPPDTVYKKIFAYNPNINSDPLKYPFGVTQIKNIYGDHLALNYNISLVNDLNSILELCKLDNQMKSVVILQKDKQIGSIIGQLQVNDGLISTLSRDNKVLEKSYNGERRWKIVWRTASIAEGGVIVYQLLKK